MTKRSFLRAVPAWGFPILALGLALCTGGCTSVPPRLPTAKVPKATATPSSPITFFPLPNPIIDPGLILAGPDGTVWFADIYTNHIGRITTSGTISVFPALPIAGRADLQEMAVGPDGAVWFTEGTPNAALTSAFSSLSLPATAATADSRASATPAPA